MANKHLQFLKVSLDVPKDLEQAFRRLDGKIKKHVIRQAVRSAVIPFRIALQADLSAIDTVQTSGASLRAVTTKVQQSKSNENRFYGIVGVRKDYFELVFPNEQSPLERLDKKLGVRQISMGVMRYDRYGRLRENKRPGRKDVQSKLMTRRGPRKRRPSKYWHLLLYGFGPGFKRGPRTGTTRKPFAGYRFLEKIRDSRRSQARRIFVDRFRELMKQQVTK